MKAISVYPGEKRIQIQDVPEPPAPGPSQVLMRTVRVGICGTDKEICSFQYGFAPPGSDFLVIGHESLMRVESVGSDVAGFKPGDLVVPTVRRPCPKPECAPCAAGRQDFCVTGDFTERGIKQAHGYMTERVLEDQKYLNHVPASLESVAVLVEPLTIAQKALIEMRSIRQRLPEAVRARMQGAPRRAVVLGAGPVGLLGALSLRAEGYETWVYSLAAPGDPRVALAESFGAKFIHAETTKAEELAAVVGNIDFIYEAVGASALAFQALSSLGMNGTFVFTGVPGRRGPIPVDTDSLMRGVVLKNQVLLGTVNAGKDAFEAAIAALAGFAEQWPAAVSGLITGRFTMENFLDPLEGKAGGIKNVIEIGV